MISQRIALCYCINLKEDNYLLIDRVRAAILQGHQFSHQQYLVELVLARQYRLWFPSKLKLKKYQGIR